MIRRRPLVILAARGIAVIFSTHDPDQAFLCADRVAVLHRGGLFRLGRPGEALTAATLYQVYGVEVTIHEVTLPDGRPTRLCLPSLARAALTSPRSR